jgi:hypothetical protein
MRKSDLHSQHSKSNDHDLASIISILTSSNTVLGTRDNRKNDTTAIRSIRDDGFDTSRAKRESASAFLVRQYKDYEGISCIANAK